MSGARQKTNKAVRLLPGGNEALDSLELFSKISLRLDPRSEAGQIAKTALDRLDSIAHAMRIFVVAHRKAERE